MIIAIQARRVKAGQSHERQASPRSCAVVVACRGDEASGLEAASSFHRIEADKIKRDVFEQGQVMGREVDADAHLIVLKDHVHAPIQAVFHRPVRADRLAEAHRVRFQAADIEALLDGFVADQPFAR